MTDSASTPAVSVRTSIMAVLLGIVGSIALALHTWLGTGSRLIPEPWASREWLIAARERFGPMVDGPIWVLLILGLLFGAWVALARDGVPVRLQRLAVVAWILPLLWALPWGSGDMYNYAEQGWAFAHGYNPNVIPAGTAPGPYQDWVGWWQGTTVAYPQLALSLSAISTMLGSSELDVLQAQRIWPVLALVMLWWAVGVLATRLGVDVNRARWLGLANPVMMLHGIAGGHHDLIALALVAVGVALWLRTVGRPIWLRLLVVAIPVVMGGLVKPTMILALVIPPLVVDPSVRTRTWFIRLVGAAGLVVGALAATVLLSGLLPGGWAWLSATGVPSEGSRTMLRDLQWMATHDRFISAGGNPMRTWFLANVEWLMIVLPLACTALLIWRRPRGGAVEVLVRMWVAILLFGPSGWPWYVLGFVPLSGLLTRRRSTVIATMAVVTTWAVPVGVAPSIADLPTFVLYWLPTVVVAAVAFVTLPPYSPWSDAPVASRPAGVASDDTDGDSIPSEQVIPDAARES